MKEVIKKIRFFDSWNFKKEEDYLNEMSQNGYEFIERRFFIYKFKKTNGIGPTFRIDYRAFDTDYKGYLEYLKFLNELGYEKIDSYDNFHYFRTLNTTDSQFLSDKDSQIDILKKLLKINIRILILTLLVNSFLFYIAFPTIDWSMIIFLGIFDSIFLFYTFNLLNSYFKLKREIY